VIRSHVHKDGRLVWTEQHNVPIFDHDGCIVAIEGIVRDVTERKKAEEELQHRLALEKVVSQVAAMLVSEDEVDFRLMLEILGKVVGTNIAHVFFLKEDGRKIDRVFEWCKSGIRSEMEKLSGVELKSLTWGIDKLKQKKNIIVPDLAELPVEASAVKKHLDKFGITSFLLVPVLSNCQLLGILGFYSVGDTRIWSDEDVRLVRMVSEIISVYTRRKQAEEALIKSEERYRSLVENQGEGVVILDSEARFTFTNPMADNIFGLPAGDLVGRSLTEFMALKNNAFVKEQMEKHPEGLKSTFELEIARSDGEKRILLVTATPNFDNGGKLTEALLIFRDATEQKQVDEKIRYFSFHDQLTGLYNRAFFEEELRRLDTGRKLPISVLIGDVNGLKLANDLFGHLDGDKLLIQIARILERSCRKHDIIARWGGDEFAIIFPGTSQRAVAHVRERIKKLCGETPGVPIKPSIALGVATKEAPEQDIQEVLREAERNMYKNKFVESKSIRSSIIFSLHRALGERVDETEHHTQELQKQALRLGKALRLPDNHLKELSLLALLHDIGKIAIPDSVLMNPGGLAQDEWEIVRKHPEIGCQIVKQASCELANVAEGIWAHHERWDGAGYPRGLKGDEIPLSSRIISVADAYDVMIRGRPFKKAVSPQDAINELVRCAGTQFDPELVNTFVKLMSRLLMEQT